MKRFVMAVIFSKVKNVNNYIEVLLLSLNFHFSFVMACI